MNAIDSGLTKGSYQVQVRLREQQEFAGSTINFADIRYAMNGVHLRGLPGTSPLIGEAQEDEAVGFGQFYSNNGTSVGRAQTGSRPQFIGNILQTAKGAISVGGTLSASNDVDFYRMTISQEDLVGSMFGSYVPVVFDMDYADGMNRPDTSINIFQEEFSSRGTQYRLIYSGDSSNIADDQRKPLTVTDVEDLSRGSLGNKDAYIGPIALPEGTYLIGISSAAYQPRAKILNPFDIKPISSIRRIVDQDYIAGVTTADPPVVQNFLPKTTFLNEEVVSAPLSLLATRPLTCRPCTWITRTPVACKFWCAALTTPKCKLGTTGTFLPNLGNGTNSIKLGLGQFAGEEGLAVVFRNTGTTTVDNIVIGFAERGEQIGAGNEPVLLSGVPFLFQGLVQQTRVFSLENYLISDGPSVTFPYQVTAGHIY